MSAVVGSTRATGGTTCGNAQPGQLPPDSALPAWQVRHENCNRPPQAGAGDNRESCQDFAHGLSKSSWVNAQESTLSVCVDWSSLSGKPGRYQHLACFPQIPGQGRHDRAVIDEDRPAQRQGLTHVFLAHEANHTRQTRLRGGGPGPVRALREQVLYLRAHGRSLQAGRLDAPEDSGADRPVAPRWSASRAWRPGAVRRPRV